MVIAEIEYSVCVDCMFYIANGELPDDEERAEEVLAGKTSGLCINSREDNSHELGFCRYPCEACGSTCHGDRYKAIQLRAVRV